MSVKTRENLTLRWAQGEVFQCKKTDLGYWWLAEDLEKSYLSCIELVNAAIKRPGERHIFIVPLHIAWQKDIAWKELKKVSTERVDKIKKRNRFKDRN